MVDRMGGALGQQWLQRLIDEAVRKQQPTDKTQGAPSTLISNLLGAAGTAAGAVGGELMKPRSTNLLPGQGGLLGGILGMAPSLESIGFTPRGAGAREAVGGAPASLTTPGAAAGAGLQADTGGGAMGGAASPMLGPEDYAKRQADSASAATRTALGLPAVPGAPEATPAGSGGSFTGGGLTQGNMFGQGGGNPIAINTAERGGQPSTPIEQITGQPVGGTGAAGGAGAPDTILGAMNPTLSRIDTVRELLDNPSFAVQDMLRDRGINPGRNHYADMMAERLTPIFGQLSALALNQAGAGKDMSEDQTVAAYNSFLNDFMGGKVDKNQVLRTALAQAEADPSGTMASLIRDMGPQGLAQLIGGMGTQGAMLDSAKKRMLGERAMDAKRRMQGLAEQGKVSDDDLLQFLPSFRGTI